MIWNGTCGKDILEEVEDDEEEEEEEKYDPPDDDSGDEGVSSEIGDSQR